MWQQSEGRGSARAVERESPRVFTRQLLARANVVSEGQQTRKHSRALSLECYRVPETSLCATSHPRHGRLLLPRVAYTILLREPSKRRAVNAARRLCLLLNHGDRAHNSRLWWRYSSTLWQRCIAVIRGSVSVQLITSSGIEKIKRAKQVAPRRVRVAAIIVVVPKK